MYGDGGDKNGIVVTAGKHELENQFEVDERGVAVGDAAHFAKTTFCIERTGARLGVKGIEADGVGGKASGVLNCFREQPAANALALQRGKDRHASDIERFLYGGKVRDIDGPGLFGWEMQRPDDGLAFSRENDRCVAHDEQHAFFSRFRGPWADAVAACEVCGDAGVQGGESGGVGGGGGGEGELHDGDIRNPIWCLESNRIGGCRIDWFLQGADCVVDLGYCCWAG